MQDNQTFSPADRGAGFPSYRESSRLGVGLIWAGALLLALFFGLLLSSGIYPIAIILVALLAGPLLLIYPTIGLWGAIVGALVAAGLIDLYLPALRPLKWGLALLSTGLASFALLSASRLQSRYRSHTNDEVKGVAVWSLLFILAAVFSSLINWHGFSAFAAGMKNYFQMWGLMVAIYFLTQKEQDASRLIRFLLLLALIQLPFVLHQFLVLVPKRSGLMAAEHGIVAVDIVAGTFGGAMNSGGRSSSLAILVAMAITILLAGWRESSISTAKAIGLGAIFLFPLLLNEAKLIVVLLPTAVFLLFRDRIIQNPLKAAVGAFAIALLMLGIFSVYLLLPGASTQHKRNLDEMYRESIDYNIGNRGYGNARLNRKTVYAFWLKEHAHGDALVHALIGHGPGATNSDSTVDRDTLATKRYPRYGIGLTGISSLLWEVGVIGLGMVLGMLFAAYRLGGRLVKRWEGTPHSAYLRAAQISVPLFGATLLHNNYFVADLSFQALLMLVLGYLLAMSKFSPRP